MGEETLNKSTNADKINKSIQSLNYNPQEILAFDGDKISSFVPTTANKTIDKFIVVTKTKHELSGNFDIAVPNARKDITYPGALLVANQKLIEGMPDPIIADLRPRNITIDLPGLTDDNSILVEKYDYAGVSAGINKLINNWLDTRAQTFTIASNTQFKKNILYNENSMALSFGVDVSYMKDKLGINFDAITKQESSAYLVQFRQIFYTVSAEPPKSPADVFSDNVKWQDISSKIDDKNPPAYVRNVQYGREVYLLLQSNMSSTDLKAHLDATLEFKNGSVATKSDLETQTMNKSINCTVITIGGKPAVINGNLGTDDILKQVNDLITDNVEFTAQNPALPLAYTVAFLKDNKLATIQGTTEYITTESEEYTSGSLNLYHGAGFVAQFQVFWEEVEYSAVGQAIVKKFEWDGNSVNRTLGFQTTIPFKPNARNIRVRIYDYTGLAWDPVFTILDQKFNLIEKRTISISGTTLAPYVDIQPSDPGKTGPAADTVLPDDDMIQLAPFNFDFGDYDSFAALMNTPLKNNIQGSGYVPISQQRIIKPEEGKYVDLDNEGRSIFTPGGPMKLGASPNGANGYTGSWHSLDKNFVFKEMKYQQSCFPCSVHTVLANLGYVKADGSEIEDLWNSLHPGGLNRTAPNEMQIHEYLSKTFELGQKGCVYTPMNFTTKEEADGVVASVKQKFLGSKGPIGLVAGVGHANVFFRTKEGKYVYFKPSPEMDSIVCEYVLITDVITLDGADGTYAIGIEYFDKYDKTVQAAHFAMIIS